MNDGQLVQLATVLISATGGVIVSWLLSSVAEWYKGHKTEAQKIAKQRDDMIAGKRAEHARAEYWQNQYRELRAWILAPGRLSAEQLRNLPVYPDIDYSE